MKKGLLNYRGVAYNRFDDGTPKEVWFTEGQDALTVRPANTPYDFELYTVIQRAIELGIITVGAQSKGIFADDNDALANGLEQGDIYELSTDNNLDPDFEGLLKVVRQNVIIVPSILGTETSSQALGTGVAGQVLGTQ